MHAAQDAVAHLGARLEGEAALLVQVAERDAEVVAVQRVLAVACLVCCLVGVGWMDWLLM